MATTTVERHAAAEYVPTERRRKGREFVVFTGGDEGPRCRASFAVFGEAERMARESAPAEGVEFFVFSFKEYRVLVRFFSNKSCKYSPPELLTFEPTSHRAS